MKFSIKTIVILTTLITSSYAYAAQKWDSYLPTDKPRTAKIMQMQYSPELKRISAKLQAATMKNQDWFKSYIQSQPPGPLPYHKNFGVSKAEYDVMLNQKNIKLSQSGSVTLTFKRLAGKRIKVITKGDSPINGTVISADKVVTPYAQLTEVIPTNNTDQNSPSGAWKGMGWRYIDFDEKAMQKLKLSEMSGKEVAFYVGKLAKSGEGIIYYKVKDVDPAAERNIEITYIIYYPLQ